MISLREDSDLRPVELLSIAMRNVSANPGNAPKMISMLECQSTTMA
jgi:hypothetical protein